MSDVEIYNSSINVYKEVKVLFEARGELACVPGWSCASGPLALVPLRHGGQLRGTGDTRYAALLLRRHKAVDVPRVQLAEARERRVRGAVRVQRPLVVRRRVNRIPRAAALGCVMVLAPHG